MAVVGDRVPADEVAPLYTHQVGFVYVPVAELSDHAFKTVVCLHRDAEAVRAAAPGARLVSTAGSHWWEQLPSDAPAILAGERADLRVRRGDLAGTPASLLVNEGEVPIVVEVGGDIWDPWSGLIHPTPGCWTLGRRASVWVVGEGRPAAAPGPLGPGAPLSLSGWRTDPDAPAGDWTADPEWETFAGTVTYTATFELAQPTDLHLDLGRVGDVAEVSLNGRVCAHLFWTPYRRLLSADGTRPGTNELVIRVTNSSANRWEGALLPSGLIGPVELTRAVRLHPGWGSLRRPEPLSRADCL